MDSSDPEDIKNLASAAMTYWDERPVKEMMDRLKPQLLGKPSEGLPPPSGKVAARVPFEPEPEPE